MASTTRHDEQEAQDQIDLNASRRFCFSEETMFGLESSHDQLFSPVAGTAGSSGAGGSTYGGIGELSGIGEMSVGCGVP